MQAFIFFSSPQYHVFWGTICLLSVSFFYIRFIHDSAWLTQWGGILTSAVYMRCTTYWDNCFEMSTSVEVRIFTLLLFPSEFFILLAIIDILTGKCYNDNWMDGWTDVRTCKCMYVYQYIGTSTYVRMHVYVCTYVRTYARMYVHTYVQKF